MPLLSPSVVVNLARCGALDIYGQASFGAPRLVKVGVLKLSFGKQKSPVQDDGSASRGRSEERGADIELLFLPKDMIGVGDLVTIRGRTVEAVAILEQFDLDGRLAHRQVSFELSVRA